jgi:diguanylate cyclase (GGDEF)-like protein
MEQKANQALRSGRTPEEYIILCICFAGVTFIAPFAVHRTITNDISLAVLDGFAVIAMAALFIYVFRTGKTRFASGLLSLIFASVLVLTVGFKGPDQILWAYPAGLAIYYLISAPKAAAINSLSTLLILVLIYDKVSLQEIIVFVITLLAINVFTAVFAIRNKIQKAQLEELSYVDALTGAANKRAFDRHLHLFENKFDRNTNDYSMIFLDIDHFKLINDTHGHPKGDQALQKLASLIQLHLNHGEKLFRVGGEEYVIFPVKLDEAKATEHAENLRKSVIESTLYSELNMTVSIGIASLNENEPMDDWVARTDIALYTAKHEGRNCSVRFGDIQALAPLQANL